MNLSKLQPRTFFTISRTLNPAKVATRFYMTEQKKTQTIIIPAPNLSDPANATKIEDSPSIKNARKRQYFKITQKRSTIGLGPRIRATIEAIGLGRTNRTVFHVVNESSAGMILKVKELVKVEVVDRKESRADMRLQRKKARGFKIIGRIGGIGPVNMTEI